MYECRCEGDRDGLRVKVGRGRIMRVCDSCRGWWWEDYSAPVTRRIEATRIALPPMPTRKRRLVVMATIHRYEKVTVVFNE